MTKKNWVFILLLVIALLVSACGTTAEPPSTEKQTEGMELEDVDTEDHQENDSDADTADDHDEDTDTESPAIDPEAIYQSKCAGCHGGDRSGGRGPSLLPDRLTGDAAQYSKIISDGQGGMPSWSGKLSAEEIDALAEWILTTP